MVEGLEHQPGVRQLSHQVLPAPFLPKWFCPNPSEVGHQHLIELKAGLEDDRLPPTNEETLVQKELACGRRSGQWQSWSGRRPCFL